jgi:hypothetical protein
LIIRKGRLEHFRCFKLLDHSRVVIDAPLFGLGEVASVKNILDSYLPFVLFNEVTKSNGSFKADESSGEVEKKVAIASLAEYC